MLTEATFRMPWECPRCHFINAPHVDRCSCLPPPVGNVGMGAGGANEWRWDNQVSDCGREECIFRNKKLHAHEGGPC